MLLGRRYSLPQATVKMALGQGITASKHFANCDARQYNMHSHLTPEPACATQTCSISSGSRANPDREKLWQLGASVGAWRMGSQACDLPPAARGSPDWWKADDNAEGKGQRHQHHRCRDIQIIPSMSGSAALTRSTLAGKSIGNSPLRPCLSRAARTASLVAKYTLDPSWTLLSPMPVEL